MSKDSKVSPWDLRYSGSDFYYGTEPNDFLCDHADLLTKGSDVLCLAEGEGRNAVFLAKLGFQVTAVDGSSVGLDKLARLAEQAKVAVTRVHADLAAFDFGTERWDGIVSIWCHLPAALRKTVHQKCAEGLKPGGLLILEAYRPKQLEYKTGGPPNAELMMTLSELQKEFGSLRLDLAQEVDREIHEGKGHDGISAVVQIVARKL